MYGVENVAAAVRNRAVGLRDELARAATGRPCTLAELLAAARAGERPWVADAEALAVLAQIIALQDVLPADRDDALTLFGLLGARSVPRRQRAVYAQLAGSVRMPVDRRVRWEIATDLANPFRARGRPRALWLRMFRVGLPAPVLGLDRRTDVPPFDRLRTSRVAPVDRPELITVVVTAHRPGEGLITAVRSLLAQSWRNLEILVVDDASPPEFDGILERTGALDPRVRVLRQAVNQGTYVARNAGLDAATGDFVTFQDSDDWSHPRRLELQVMPLLTDPAVVASTSDGRRVTEDLLLVRLGRRGGKLNPSALMFRREAVLETVGYLDVVRKGGDSEYIERIAAAFGARAVRHLPTHLALIRLSGGSLSRAEIRPYWIHPARAVYRSGYVAWHRRIAAGEVAAFRPRDGADRPFPAPTHLLRSASDQQPTELYDVLVAADWRFHEETQRSALAEIEALLRRGLRVAILHLEDWRRPARKRLPVHHTAQDLVNAGRLGQVALTDPVRCGVLLVRQAAVLRYPPGERVRISPRTVLVLLDEAPQGVVDAGVFGVPPLWCPQSAEIRALFPDLPLTDFDLPMVAVAGPSVSRRAPIPAIPVVGAEVTDRRQLRGLTGADVRLRLADGVRLPRQPADRLVYRAAEVAPLEFLGQLDFYLDLSASRRSVLDATAMGCIVLAPDEAAEAMRRYQADPALVAERRRQDLTALRKAHDPDRFAVTLGELCR
ncbi:glycosyltransferase family 2 protein [Actinoplanes siamensis]|uniref:Glycosyltransferase 2-like domain-containing protein n=1 Tax=Actinoplanes siamensis TaxID=1223317 RepID=A0A919KB78_9ACTN|nr:glycosyltransferase family A protein [Actinoplanes siamensis]GIF02948.1 hypothetical protein Asi03nite_04860 [Actinoplanes siamensis]